MKLQTYDMIYLINVPDLKIEIKKTSRFDLSLMENQHLS